MKNKMLTICLVLIIGGCDFSEDEIAPISEVSTSEVQYNGTDYTEAAPKGYAKTTTHALKAIRLKKLHQWVHNCLTRGFIHSIDVENNEVRINTATWMFLANIEAKQMVVGNFSEYFDLKGSTGRVTIRSMHSDEKLASYSVWTGIKIYK